MFALCLSSFAMDSFDVQKELSKDLKSKGTRAKVADLEGKTVVLTLLVPTLCLLQVLDFFNIKIM